MILISYLRWGRGQFQKPPLHCLSVKALICGGRLRRSSVSIPLMRLGPRGAVAHPASGSSSVDPPDGIDLAVSCLAVLPGF